MFPSFVSYDLGGFISSMCILFLTSFPRLNKCKLYSVRCGNLMTTETIKCQQSLSKFWSILLLFHLSCLLVSSVCYPCLSSVVPQVCLNMWTWIIPALKNMAQLQQHQQGRLRMQTDSEDWPWTMRSWEVGEQSGGKKIEEETDAGPQGWPTVGL